MEILYLDGSVKLKGKNSSLIVDPTKTTKTAADAVIFLENSAYSLSSDVNNSQRLIIMGPGEYEIGGIKIRGEKLDSDFLYTVFIDGIEVLLVRAEALERAHGKVKASNIVVCASNVSANPSHLLSLQPNVIVLYGTSATEISKGLGKESVNKTAKYAVTAEKLPMEMEVVILG